MKQFFFTILYQPFYNLLIFIAWLIPGHSVGWAIIALTVIIRLALLPSSVKTAYFQVKNMELQPKVNKIKAEIKDSVEQNKAIMELYKQEGHSPFGSCLPTLIQLPILIVLFSVFKSGLNLTGYKDLYGFTMRPETVNTMFAGFDITQPDPWVLPIVAGVLQMFLSLMTMPKKDKNEVKSTEPDPMAMMSKQMIFFAPLITVFFGRTMPAALVIYWIVTTIFSIGQQYYVNNKVKQQKLTGKPLIIEPVKTTKVIQAKSVEKVEAKPAPATKKTMMEQVMAKRLDNQEKKAGVNVTVRTKKSSSNKW